MKSLQELTATDDPAIAVINELVRDAQVPVEVLPASVRRDEVLLEIQITTQSFLGAVAYETGGMLIDDGWLRILGSGHDRLSRSLPDWNRGKASGFYLVADDVAGGFFAINGGAFGKDFRKMYYFAPDRLVWESMDIEFSQFVAWSLTKRIEGYYENLRWAGWRDDVKRMNGDRCYFWMPPLWTTEGKGGRGDRTDIPVSEAWDVSLDFKAQLDGDTGIRSQPSTPEGSGPAERP